MAYLDADALYAAAAGRTAVPPAPAALSPLEWSVVALAKNESLRSLNRPGRVSRAIGGLFGLGETSPLADPRLEALRRLAIHAWHRGFALPAAEIDRVIAAGFTEAQIEMMVVSITGIRIGADRRGRAA
ncbi:hypothetical protein [Sphingomonas solaris]|uniref:Uncharacterized protein n=1 Tax=Alterirhizorhabdus solaris TaxID=2529389 RepID=A0A558QTV8_9SPHN|nr:hypothetical protein [Sphingomonas solaris]TVV70573.1 hypothetical protein FOY91_18840 [Sphingomonas solaris]